MREPQEVEVGRQERIWGEVLRSRTGEGCTSGENLIAFVENRLDAARRLKVAQHLGHCSGCRDTVFQLREAESASRPRSRGWRGLLASKRFAMSGGAVFAVVAAAVWITTSTGHVARSGLTVGGTTFGTIGKDPRRPSESKDIVAINENGGTSEVGNRAMKMVLLLGGHHVFKLKSKDSHLAERKKIEESYADQVSIKQTAYKKAAQGGTDAGEVNRMLRLDLEELSAQRDAQLADLYPMADDVRASHPELRVDESGPYQVVEVGYHKTSQVPEFDEYVVAEPWPGYDASEKPYGWRYGKRYQRPEFKKEYTSWHDTHTGSGHPAFYGLKGHSGPVEVAAITRTSAHGYVLNSHYSHSLNPQSAVDDKPESVTTQPGPSRYSHTLDGLH